MLLSNEDIKKIIPHRYPFLLVDKIESIDEETKPLLESSVSVPMKCSF